MDFKHTEDLLNALLRRRENSEEMIEELNGYVGELKAGELLESDARYIEALAKRFGVAPRSGAAPDHGGADHDVPEPDVPEPKDPRLDVPGDGVSHQKVVPGSFLERARTMARETLDKHRPASEADQRTVMERISDQLDGLAARLEEEVLKDARGDGVLPVPTGQVRMVLMRDGDIPALFVDGNERELETTPGYIRLAARCDELALRLTFETGHEDAYQEQRDPGAPSLYPAHVVISGWV